MTRSIIEVSGGAYEGREGITATHVNGRIVINAWYDGCYGISPKINMTVKEFLRKLNINLETYTAKESGK